MIGQLPVARDEAFISDHGATAVEYALMVGLVALAIVGGVTLLGQAVSGLFQSVVTNWPG